MHNRSVSWGAKALSSSTSAHSMSAPAAPYSGGPLPLGARPGAAQRKVPGKETENRVAYVNESYHNPYGANDITTSKYTAWSFFARSLLEQ